MSFGVDACIPLVQFAIGYARGVTTEAQISRVDRDPFYSAFVLSMIEKRGGVGVTFISLRKAAPLSLGKGLAEELCASYRQMMSTVFRCASATTVDRP